MKSLLIALGLLSSVSVFAQHADLQGGQRQAEIAKRGPDVMPFPLAATTHVFTKSKDGGIQRVIAKNAADTAQIKLVRDHLQDIRAQFLKGDFSGPSHLHGDDMPGLAELKSANPSLIRISYRDVQAGAELRFRTADAKLIGALHKWFDAQLYDHGADAMASHHGHQH